MIPEIDRLRKYVQSSRDPAALMALMRLQRRLNRSADAQRFVEIYGMQPLVSVSGDLINPFDAFAIGVDRPGRNGSVAGGDRNVGVRQRAWQSSGFGARHLGWYTSHGIRHIRPIKQFDDPQPGPFDYEPGVVGYVDDSGRGWSVSKARVVTLLTNPPPRFREWLELARELANEIEVETQDEVTDWRPVHSQLMYNMLRDREPTRWGEGIGSGIVPGLLHPSDDWPNSSAWAGAYVAASHVLQALQKGESGSGMVQESMAVPIRPMVRLSQASPLELWVCSKDEWQESSDCLLFALMPSKGDLLSESGLQIALSEFDYRVEAFSPGWSEGPTTGRYKQSISSTWQDMISHASVWRPGEQVQYLGERVEFLADKYDLDLSNVEIGRSSNAAFLMAVVELHTPVPIDTMRGDEVTYLPGDQADATTIDRFVVYVVPRASSPIWVPCVPLSALVDRIRQLSERADLPSWDALRGAAAAWQNGDTVDSSETGPSFWEDLSATIMPWGRRINRKRRVEPGSYVDGVTRNLMDNLGPFDDMMKLLDQ